jgi:bifunctional UDP-N-acetylglucosamine pyrophosphorylase/glucosamine-1-phosphate N-acetyltransferase
MGSYVLDTLAEIGVRQGVVVTGNEGGRIAKRLLEDTPGFPVRFVEQKVDRGTADAVLLGLSGFDDFNDDEDLLVVPADLPLLRAGMIQQLLDTHRDAGSACTVLSVRADSGNGFDRVLRDRHGRVTSVRPLPPSGAADGDFLVGIRAHADAERVAASEEAATGVYCIRRGLLAPALRRATGDGRGAELRLAGAVEVLAESGHTCESVTVEPAQDLRPVGSRIRLAEAEAEMRRRTNRYWLSMGVTMVDPDRTYIDTTVRLGTDVTLFPGTILQGTTNIGDGCELGPDVRLDRCTVGASTRIEQATATLASIGNDCNIGPYAVLNPGSSLPPNTSTGAFYAGGTP